MPSANPTLKIDFLILNDIDPKWVAKFTSKVPGQLSKFKIEAKVTPFQNDVTDSRIEEHEANATNWVALVSNEIKLFPKNLGRALEQINKDREATIVYFDSVIRGQNLSSFSGERPDFSPERIRSQNYLGPLVLFRRDVFLKLISEAPNANRSALVLWLLLAATRNKESFLHIAVPCYSETNVGDVLHPVELQEISKVLQHHLDRTGGGVIRETFANGMCQTSRKVKGSPLVSIVIPTKGVFSFVEGEKSCYVINAVRSIVELTDYEHFELVVVVDSIAEEAVLSQLKKIVGNKLKIVVWDKAFNFSQKMNFGVLHASGDYVLLLNDDVKVITRDWLSSMLALAQLPNAGMVGAMLYYDDETIQHAGHAYYLGSPTHIGLGLPRGTSGHNHSFLVEREVSGVTAACALMPKKVFLDVGGFSALLPGNFNDVDLCLKTGWKGYDIYWTPFAELYHYESKTRDAHVHYYELDVIEGRWGLRLDDQRFWRGHPWRAN